MFRLDATVDGGAFIRADGSENFPKGYQELEKVLYRQSGTSRAPNKDLDRTGAGTSALMTDTRSTLAFVRFDTFPLLRRIAFGEDLSLIRKNLSFC